ncbi:MAG: cation transporter [Paracoccaceae bacterium]|nr:cation transporter [Paracoccaceae bacterium]
MPHDHHHHHHHHAGEGGDRRVALAIAVNVVLSAAQIVGGVFAGSVALIADAVHNLSDAAALGLAFAARRIARRPADARMTFGYGRAEVVAALINYTALIVISIWLAAEGVMRLIHPPAVQGWVVVWLAGLALVINGGTAALTFALSKDSMNIRAAFLHNLGDAATSLAVMVAGTLIILYDWRLIDPLVTLAISGWMLWLCVTEIGPVIRILMLGAPPGVPAAEVLARISSMDGVEDVHHLHLWQIDEHETSVEAHLVLGGDAAEVAARVRTMLLRDFHIHHATLAIETEDTRCRNAPDIGCAA